MEHREFALIDVAIAGGLFLGMLLFLEMGRRMGIRQVAKRGTAARSGVGVVDGTVYGLLGLLLGFAFSGAAARFDKRRELVVHQVNAMSTAWMRLDLMQPERQVGARPEFRRYTDALLAAYANAPGSEGEVRERDRLRQAQTELWSQSVAASLAPGGDPARIALLPALNEMFDAVDAEQLAQRIHPPQIIYVMLGLTALAAALFGGFALSNGPSRNWMYSIGVAGTISVALFVILELESPRLGLIRVDGIDRALHELRATMEPTLPASSMR
jgi:hypothetical protein